MCSSSQLGCSSVIVHASRVAGTLLLCTRWYISARMRKRPKRLEIHRDAYERTSPIASKCPYCGDLCALIRYHGWGGYSPTDGATIGGALAAQVVLRRGGPAEKRGAGQRVGSVFKGMTYTAEKVYGAVSDVVLECENTPITPETCKGLSSRRHRYL